VILYDLLKIGEFMKKLFSNIIIDLILFDLLFGITCLIMDKLDLEYLKWVKQTILIINSIGIILGIIVNKYKNIFTREKNRTYEENYGKGAFNPFEEEYSILAYYYYDKEGKLEKQIDTIQESEDLQEKF
jgi:hypothetical protein